MIDLHCHILPGIDDGSEDYTVSVGMALMAQDAGITTVVATPHCNEMDGDMASRCKLIKKRVAELQYELDERHIDLKVLPGMELFARENLEDILDSGNFLTLGDSRYLLIEFDFEADIEEITDGVEIVLHHGLIPVLAHPERYDAIQFDPRSLIRLFEEGTVIQVNKGSVLGQFGHAPQETVEWILRHGLAHVLSSDAHGVKSRRIGFNKPFNYISSKYSGIYAEILMNRNPERIIRNKSIVST